MTKTLTFAFVAGVFALVSVANANAFTRNGSVTGPAGGTGSVSASGGCSGGTCSRTVKRTGPYGGSVSRSGSASCNSGTCTGTRTTTGPNGGSVVRNGSISR
ncbi:MAG: hypothetical protein LCH47_04555 [Proteobacteria bacterium]|nr:hypothetical protein [Pseudomonadota bacterium]